MFDKHIPHNITIMLFEKIVQNYTDYIRMDYDAKLHAGELLAESARLLLQIDKKKLDNKSALQREFLIRKIAGDLLRQMINMAHTKQYDCSPILKDYTYLAFDLAYDYCEFKPDRRLLPFLANVISYKKDNNELNDLYTKSLALEKEHIKNLIDADNPVYKTDIWGF